MSYFGGPAWTLDTQSNQYYLHLFLSDQPDLNWRNPAVQRQFEEILRFWLDRGVDGFRVDVAQGMVKDKLLRSNPTLGRWDQWSTRSEQWAAFDHIHDVLQPESRELFARWKEVCSDHDAVLIGETSVGKVEDLASLLQGDGLDFGFWLEPLHRSWGASAIRAVLQDPLDQLERAGSIAWQSSSLDEPRAASRFGGGREGQERALALAVLLFCLPGLPFLYQGEELGLVDGVVGTGQRADPVGDEVNPGRDGSRTPMPWEPGPTFGFSSTGETWLPHGGRVDSDTASFQKGVAGSWLERYRSLVRLRLDCTELRSDAVEWLEATPPDTIAFRRGGILVVLNLGHRSQLFDLVGSVLFNTHEGMDKADGVVSLEPAQAIVMRESDVGARR